MIQIVFFLTVALAVWFSVFIYNFVPMGGDRAVGQAWMLFFIGFLLSISVIVLFILMARKSCFLWLHAHTGIRTVMVVLFCVAVILTVFFSGVFSIEWYGDSGYPLFLRYLSMAGAYIWVPVIVLIPFYLLIRSPLDPSGGLKLWVYSDMVLCSVYSLALLGGWMRDSYMTGQAKMQQEQATYDEYHQKNLEEIKTYSPDAGIYGLLSHSYILRPKDIHDAALQKIMERPQWENEVLDVLRDRDAYIESYYFLSGNPVTHPELFHEPLKLSIGYLAEDAGLYLREANNIQDWILDHFNIGPMLMAIDFHFKSEADQFVPAVKRLRDTILQNTPAEHKKIRFNAVRELDAWLGKNR